MAKLSTLDTFLSANPSKHQEDLNDIIKLFRAIENASKVVHREVNRAGLAAHILGAAGNTNVQGEEQQKLDVYADEQFIAAFADQGVVCGIGSEENDHYLGADAGLNKDASFIVMMDPLDGSSNIDVNVSIGTIFSIYKRVSTKGQDVNEADFLQKGREQVAAGYVLYGSSTMLVYTLGDGTHSFTYENSLGLFCLGMSNVKAPKGGKIYSINEGNYGLCEPSLQKYLDATKGNNNLSGKPMTARYIGSLVADFHRNLLKGGVYLYPGTSSAPKGKLRLQYEANPLAFIIEQCGGKASDGVIDIMDIQPKELHQRTPLFIGSTDLVDEIHSYIK